jgi:hypothetical protein
MNPHLLLPVLFTLFATNAWAGQPGSGDAVGMLGASALLDDAARVPLGLGIEGRVSADIVSDLGLDLRGELLHTRLPPRSLESFMLENPDPAAPGPVPDSVRFSQWEGRMALAAAFRPTSREAGLRARLGVLGVLSGSAGATAALSPIGWDPDYTAAFRAGPVGAVGLAIPIGGEVGDPLIDVRLGGSWAIPVAAAGGLVGGAEPPSWLLTVDGTEYQASDLVGREARGWVEGTATWGAWFAGAQVGLEHNARSTIARARALSPDWEVSDIPEKVAPHAQVTVGFVF